MALLIFFVDKFFVFTFIFAILFLLKELLRFIRGLNTGEYKTKKYTMLWIGIAISYVLTMLITGFIV